MDALWEKRPFEVPVVVLDTETTGLYPEMGHRIVELAAVRLEGGREVANINTLLQPGRPLDAKASAINGITDDDLIGQPAFSEIYPELAQLLEGALVVAHNASFDAGFVGMELMVQHWQQPDLPAMLPNPWLCTLQLARRHFYFGRNNLGSIAQQMGIRMGKAHRALNDVYMTAEILKRMVRDLAKRRMETVGDLLHAQGGAIYMPHPPDILLPDEVGDALENGRDLRILYLGKSGESTRIITPLYPTEYQGEAYLVAYCHSKEAQRTFRLDRIFSAQTL